MRQVLVNNTLIIRQSAHLGNERSQIDSWAAITETLPIKLYELTVVSSAPISLVRITRDQGITVKQTITKLLDTQ